MQVSVAHHPPNTAVLVLRGSLDIDTAPVLKANLARLVDRPSPRVVVDVSGLDFCDSMGVGVLVTAHGRAMERGGWSCESTYRKTYSYVFDSKRVEANTAINDFFTHEITHRK